ncbi:MAG: hypothetical protein GXY32_04050 [Ruminococcaceae bacterium]|nr:hypothetical protein [Oscillospiraceae bacterium]
MKTKVSVALAMLLAVVLLAGCGPKVPESALVAYTSANAKMKETTALAADITINIAMTAMGQEADVGITAHVAQAPDAAGNVQMATEMSMGFMGMSLDMNMYYTDGMMYMDAMSSKVKSPMSFEDARQQGSPQVNVDITENAIKEQHMETTDDGYVLTFVLDGEAMADALKSQLGSALGDADANLNIGDINTKAVVGKDGQMKSMEMDFTFAMDTQGQMIEAACTMSMTNIQTKDVTVTLPDDLDSYTETEDIGAVSPL